MSISEIAAMYREGELDLHPEFQRFFRWTEEQKSRFVESLLLGIPVPPVFVSERPDSKWDVIDGMQRLSTILEVMGELLGADKQPVEMLMLIGTRYLPSLEGMRWISDAPEMELPESVKIKIKRARLDVNIVKNTSDDVAKYEIFQRLNTGGSLATDQEVRSCILLMNSPKFHQWIDNLVKQLDFRSTIPLSEQATKEAFDLELVTRFIVFTSSTMEPLRHIDELGAFLTEQIINQSQNINFDFAGTEDAFMRTFRFLSETLGEDSFRRYDTKKKRYQGALLVSLFEVVAVGIGRRLLRGYELPDATAFFTKHRGLWENMRPLTFVGSGVRASTRIPSTIDFGEHWLGACE
jgi:hypothetical protein